MIPVKIKNCKYCGRAFHLGKYSPGQSCCNHADCRKARDAERQKLYYREKIKDAVWQAKLSERKKHERFRRLKLTSCDKPPTVEQITSVTLPSHNDALIFGILSLINGSRTYEELKEFRDSCIKFGMEVFPPSVTACIMQNGQYS